jgi:hypothetical protein
VTARSGVPAVAHPDPTEAARLGNLADHAAERRHAHAGRDQHARALHAAREFGDEAMALGLECSLDALYETVRHNGARRYREASLMTNGTHAIARLGCAGAAGELLRGEIPTAGRSISSCARAPDRSGPGSRSSASCPDVSTPSPEPRPAP